jgi:hypothetical protein
LGAGQSVGTSLAIQTSANTPLGSYPVVVTGSDGTVNDLISITLQVSDFSMNVSAPSSTIVTGGSINFGLTVVPIGGWSDLVNVTCQITPQVPAGCNAQGAFPPGISSISWYATSIPAGDYSVTFSGSAEGVTHSAPAVTIHVGGANGSVSPASATVSVGSSANFNVTLNSQNGFTDQFTFSCPNIPAGVTCTFSPPSGMLPSGGSLSSVLTVSVTSKPSTGSVPVSRFYGQDQRRLYRALLLIWAGFFVLCLKIKFPAAGRRAYTAITFASGLVLIVSIVVACGGGSVGGVSPGQPPPPPPTPQSATVTISVQASSNHLNSPLGVLTVTVP